MSVRGLLLLATLTLFLGCENKQTSFATDSSGNNYYISTLNPAESNFNLPLSKSYETYAIISNPTLTNFPNNPSISTQSTFTKATQAQLNPNPTATTNPPLRYTYCGTRNISSQSRNSTTTTVRSNSVNKNAMDSAKVGDVLSLYTSASFDTRTSENMILKKITVRSDLTLKVWLESNITVDDALITKLADSFLSPTSTHDIFHWETGMIGLHWGEHSHPDQYIASSAKNEFNIFLIDTNNGGSGRLLGFFNWDDVTLKSSSNEHPIVYLDANLLANTSYVDATHTLTWQNVIFSTLAHEFQHMINHYQKTIKKGLAITSPWEDEMASLMMEQLVAAKLGIPAPSNLRIPTFNQRPYYTFAEDTDTFYTCSDNLCSYYGSTFAYGAYLLRNFGGAKFMHDFIQSDVLGTSSVDDALKKGGYKETFKTTARKFGTAVALSDNTNVLSSYQFNNKNGFSSTYNGVTYTYPSINFFSFSPSLTVSYDQLDVATQKASNTIVYLGKSVGDAKVVFHLPDNARATVIGK